MCHTPRYKQVNSQLDAHAIINRKIPIEVVRYFPLIPRLQRLFMSLKIASQMIWHADERVDDENVRNPDDYLSWKTFDDF